MTFWGVPADPRHDTARGTCLDQFDEFNRWRSLECLSGAGKAAAVVDHADVVHGSVADERRSRLVGAPGQFTPPKEYTFQNSAANRMGRTAATVELRTVDQRGARRAAGQALLLGLTVECARSPGSELEPDWSGGVRGEEHDGDVARGRRLEPGWCGRPVGVQLGEVGLESAGEQSCPESSKIGTVEIKTPLLPNPLVGAAYLAEQNANPFGSLVAMYIVVYDPVSGVRVKVAGEVKPDPVTGQLVSTFDETPQLPFEDLSLHFFGGSRAPLGTPALCGGYTTTASIAPWSGNAAGGIVLGIPDHRGPNGSPCANPLPFDPSLTTGSLNIQAGAFTPFTMTMSQGRRQPEPGCDPAEDASGAVGDALVGQVVRGSGRERWYVWS